MLNSNLLLIGYEKINMKKLTKYAVNGGRIGITPGDKRMTQNGLPL